MAAEPTVCDLALAEFGQRFARLRIVHPSAELHIRRSLEKYGQLSAVVVSAMEDQGSYELLDGFKRFRAARELGWERLKARCLPLGSRAAKAAILQLNWVARSVHQLEEALVLFSLVREDALTQVEIAALVGRHKSWVSRRVALVERLGEEVKESLRLGLTSVSIARELGRLPRGNQESVLGCLHKHGLTCRETRTLVSVLLARPRWEWDTVLKSPWEVLPERLAPRPDPAEAGRAADTRLREQLLAFGKCATALVEALAAPLGPEDTRPRAEELSGLSVLAAEAADGARRALDALESAFGTALSPVPSRAWKDDSAAKARPGW